jgi:penicillin-binding protein 2
MLYVVFVIPVLLIGLRLVWLQVVIPERFIEVWTRTTESFETLPATDGRILSSDGQILAYDQPRYSIEVHYRWLEEPVNADWLKARVRERLPRNDRNNAVRIAETQFDILREREQLWQSLTALTGRTPEQLTERRQAIQRKIEDMSHAVHARREARVAASTATLSTDSLGSRLWRELSTPPERASTQPLILREELEAHTLLDDVPIEQIATIEAQPSRFPGVEIRSSSERIYPLGQIAPHVIGLRTAVDATAIELRKARFPNGDPLALEVGDRYGKNGIERAYDTQLRGIRGLRRVIRNHAGEIIEQEVTRPPRNGSDITLTIDAALQQQAEQLLDEALAGEPLEDSTEATPDGSQEAVVPSAGAIVVLDLRSGETLIAASSPRYDLAAMQHPSKAQWSQWSKDPRHPFLSRVTQATVPPGSVFKVVTAIAGLEQGTLSPEQPFHCQGYLNDPQHDRCYVYRHFGRGHGDVTLPLALSQSCNVYFYDVAERLGPQPIENWARRLGFGSPTGLDNGGERAGHVPSRSAAGQTNRWYPGTTRQFAIGQADLTVTPLQVAKLMAIIGNGGRAITPRLIQPEAAVSSAVTGNIQLASAESVVFRSAKDLPFAERKAILSPPPSPEPLLSDRTLQAIREGLELTVEHPQGTGHKAQVPGLLVAGKTGTAQVGGDKPDHAWFAGYVPADRPRYAFAVFLEHGGSGGKAAAPLARQVIMSMIEADLLSIRPVTSVTEE